MIVEKTVVSTQNKNLVEQREAKVDKSNAIDNTQGEIKRSPILWEVL
jgi:hypothetical protein